MSRWYLEETRRCGDTFLEIYRRWRRAWVVRFRRKYMRIPGFDAFGGCLAWYIIVQRYSELYELFG